MPLNEPDVSLIIPAFNEAARLPQSLRKIVEFTGGNAFSCEVLVVVEKSTDGTLELAREIGAKQANFKIVDNEIQLGKGHAVRSGMRVATGKIQFYMDADLSVPLEDMLFFLDYFRTHPEVDVVIGNRQHKDSKILVKQPPLREKMGKAFNRIIQSLSLLDVRDTQCGFKAFRKKASHAIFYRQRLDGFAFDVEVLLLAKALGFTIVDLPVHWVNSPDSKVNIVRDSLQMFLDTVRVRRLVERTARETRGSHYRPLDERADPGA